MTNEAERNQEFSAVINSDRERIIGSFVQEFDEELDDIERTLDTEASLMLLNWVRDKLHSLEKDFHANL